MALATNALTNVATLESVLGLASGSADTLLERVINQASAIAESYAGRVFYRNTAITEKHSGQIGPELVLNQAPVNGITSVTYLSGNAEASTSYEIQDANVGSVYRINGYWHGVDSAFRDSSRTTFTGQGRLVWTFVYDGGWYTPKQEDDAEGTRTLPYDIESAVTMIAVHLYHAEARDTSLKSERLMEGSQSFVTVGGGSSGVAWLETAVPGAAMILRRYRRGIIG